LSPRAGKDRATDVYRQPGITDPRRDIDAVEMYVPFSWYEPMRLENLGFTAPGEGS
jgi:acetyl-CoA C-acetyltransferase